jgi:serine/threonine-protein kinase
MTLLSFDRTVRVGSWPGDQGRPGLAVGEPLALLGRQLGRWELEALLGRGGFAWVFRATARGRLAAVKILANGGDGEQRERFAAEVTLLRSLAHPLLPQVHEAAPNAPLPWMAMELCPGPTLERWLRWRGPLPVRSAVALVERLSVALAYVHARGVVHRDVKPANVAVRELAGQLFPKLLDFGVAMTIGQSRREQSMVGSPAYAAPEQWALQRTCPRTDQYALGLLLYECLTGRRAVPGRTASDYENGHLCEPLAEDPQVPPAIHEILIRACAKRREDRFADLREFHTTLHRAAATALRRFRAA